MFIGTQMTTPYAEVQGRFHNSNSVGLLTVPIPSHFFHIQLSSTLYQFPLFFGFFTFDNELIIN